MTYIFEESPLYRDMISSWTSLCLSVTSCGRLTLIQPVSEAVEDNPLLASGNQADRSALYRCLVVDVVFKYEDLDRGVQSISLFIAVCNLRLCRQTLELSFPAVQSRAHFSSASASLSTVQALYAEPTCVFFTTRLIVNPERSTATDLITPKKWI